MNNLRAFLNVKLVEDSRQELIVIRTSDDELRFSTRIYDHSCRLAAQSDNISRYA